MKMSNVMVFRKVFIIVAILILLVSMLTAIGTAYGRYLTVISEESNANVKSKPTITVLGGESWICETVTDPETQKSAQIHKLNFSLKNYRTTTSNDNVVEVVEDRDVAAAIRIFAPAANNAQVILVCNGVEYKGVPEAVAINSPIGKEHGTGMIFRFFDSNSEELVWRLNGGIKKDLEMIVSVTGVELEEGTTLDFKLSVDNKEVNN